MVKVQEVFDIAIMLMDEQSETNGNTHIADTEEYRFRTIDILNSIMPHLYPYSATYDLTQPGRPAPPPLLLPNKQTPDFEQEIPLDDSLARGVLPYGLAYRLLAPEDPDLSQRIKADYMAAFLDLQDKLPASFEPITPPYGLF